MLLRGVFPLKGKTSIVFISMLLLCAGNFAGPFPKIYRFRNPCFATNVSNGSAGEKLVELYVTRKKLQDILALYQSGCKKSLLTTFCCLNQQANNDSLWYRQHTGPLWAKG